MSDRTEAGSVLLLVPAGILVLLVLAAVCVDSAIVLAAQRDLSARTAAAANDLGTVALDDDAFYRGGGAVAVDERRADAYLRLVFADDARPPIFTSWSVDAEASGGSVVVAAEAEVEYVFAKAIPGVAHRTRVEARSVASTQGG